MSNYTRSIELKRESVDPKTGTFEAVLFTDGEASDGHILSMKGANLPARMPLFINHDPDPRSQVGSLEPLRVEPHAVVVRGQILLDGVGDQVEGRRDLLVKMQAGHVGNMSGRWDAEPGDVKPRSELPKSHPAYAESGAPGPRGFGMYFEKWRAMEGSIVGLGADPQATTRWAEEAESPAVAQFWRSLLHEETEPAPEVPIVAEAIEEDAPVQREDQPSEEIVEASDEDTLRTLLLAQIKTQERMDALLERLSTLEEAREPTDDTSVATEGTADQGIPSPPPKLEDVASLLRDTLDQFDSRVESEFVEYIHKLTGKVS